MWLILINFTTLCTVREEAVINTVRLLLLDICSATYSSEWHGGPICCRQVGLSEYLPSTSITKLEEIVMKLKSRRIRLNIVTLLALKWDSFIIIIIINVYTKSGYHNLILTVNTLIITINWLFFFLFVCLLLNLMSIGTSNCSYNDQQKSKNVSILKLLQCTVTISQLTFRKLLSTWKHKSSCQIWRLSLSKNHLYNFSSGLLNIEHCLLVLWHDVHF